MARKFNYRGKTVEELKKMTTEELLKLLTSRARRYVRHQPFRYRRLLQEVKLAQKAKGQGHDVVIKTHLREAVILPDWVGLKFGIHNGREYKNIEIIAERIGRRLGEYSHTTYPVKHSGPGVGATRGSKFIPLK